MSAPNHAGSDGEDRSKSNNNSTESTVAKTAGIFVFSGIAMSILKALNPWDPQNSNNTSKPSSLESVSKPLQEPKKSVVAVCDGRKPATSKIVEIVKGDTLWGLSRKYGVSIDELKEANGLTGDTIYAGKKLVIP